MKKLTDEQIKQIFNTVKGFIPKDLDRADEYLVCIEQNVIYNSLDLEFLRGFVRGLWAANAINIEHDVDDLDKLLEKFGAI